MSVATRLAMAQNAERPGRQSRPACGYSTGAEGRAEWVDRSPIFSTSWAETQEDMLMADYTIANIPTLYRGRMYRSRLEARWAAFFDRLGWTHEYEPFDLGVWSPDFAITEPFDALVEVKPITEPEHALFERVHKAARDQLAFVTCLAPVVDQGFIRIGWWARFGLGVGILWVKDEDRPAFQADIYSHTTDGKLWAIGSHGGGSSDNGPFGWPYADYTMGLWVDACNAVQWEPRR